MQKYGFVYIWYDRKHKRYYVGCRWGDENDGYVCSSSWMKASYKKRPEDFKRRILARVYTNKKDLLAEEYKWLSMMKADELHGPRYYNMHNHHFNHWTSLPDEERTKSIGEKISARHKGRTSPTKGKKATEATKQKIREANAKQFSDPEQREIRRQKIKALWEDPEYRAKQVAKKLGKKQTQEHIQKRLEKNKQHGIYSSGYRNHYIMTDGEKQAASARVSNYIWYTNGEVNKRIPRDASIPEGFVPGRCKKVIV